MTDLSQFSPNHLPVLPRRRDWRIGCLGAGFIMRDCHLVAYREAGFNPVAIASRDPANARAVAGRHGIPTVHATIDELIEDPSIEVLDIAVPPDVQPALILKAARQKHLRGILAQKPLAMTVAEATACVEACESAGVVLSVNQNMRFDQSVRAMKGLLNSGDLGDIVLASIDMRAIPHWMPWSEHLHSLSTFVMSIHHLDTFRYWLGTPDRVLASTRPDPRTKFPHTDGINLYILEYDSGARATGWDDVWTGPAREGAASDIGIRWRVEGTKGMAKGTIGWPGYPARVPSTLDYTLSSANEWHKPRWPEVWFPDAFVGTMAQLLVALEDNTPPEISARDNLETLALCEAVFRSAAEHRVTTMREFLP
ncbi:Gfo/Idh/MocA family protein [Zavarzinella formosa]|uniref:Gfo/Idh/MocA family protein n=1 Tax=Zavarzinella formosa TaxID=360055 RepID=UPI000313F3A2|nr:Gfo/Idh/MocA family oxidoreductase [Zavarzinella formosa]